MPEPIARAASTNSISFTVNTDERASRAYCGMYTMPTASMTLVMLGPRIVVMPIARMIGGNASITSIAPISAESSAPPK